MVTDSVVSTLLVPMCGSLLSYPCKCSSFVACELYFQRPLGRPRRRWEDNIRMDLQEVGLGYEDWIGRAQDRDRWRARMCAVRNLRVP